DDNILAIVRKGEQLLFNEWVDFFLERYSKPPLRAARTHEANLNALKQLKPTFGRERLSDITAEQVEEYLHCRLRQRVKVRTLAGFREFGTLKPTTVHQEFRVLRRILNVAVKKKLIPWSPCAGVEFPVAVTGLFRPHYMTWSEQQRIEFHAP